MKWAQAILIFLLGSTELFGAVHPLLLSPEDGAPVQTDSVTLSWFCSDRTTFDVYLGHSGSFTKISQNVTDSHVTITGLEQGNAYLWFVAATDSLGVTTTSDTARFLTPSRSYASTITGNGSFDLHLDGSVDGLNSSGPMFSLIESTWRIAWQPNIEACISNIGATPIVKPHLEANGRGRWWDLDTIVSDVTAGLTNDADRARALFEHFSRNRFWSEVVNLWPNGRSEGEDPVRMLNVYGFNHCGGAMTNMVQAALAAGLRARQVNIQAHTVAEVGYGGSWHQYDTDGAALFLNPDNATVASVDQIIADPSMVYQTPIFGLEGERLLGRPQREISQVQASRYDAPWYNLEGVYHPEALSRMDLTLYPDEAIHFGYARAAIRRPKLSTTVPVPDAAFANGRLTFVPRLSASSLWKERASTLVNLESSMIDGRIPCIHPVEASTWGRMVIPFYLPYRIMDGVVVLNTIRSSGADSLVLKMRLQGTVEIDLPLEAEIGEAVQAIRLGQYFDFASYPVYSLALEIRALSADRDSTVGIDSLAVSLDLLMNPRSLPQLEAGANHVTFTQEGKGTAQVSYAWTPLTSLVRPSAPTLIAPAEGAVVRGTRPEFVWAARSPSTNDPIVKCEIQVSERADMRWPISSLFDAIVSAGISSDTAHWIPPYGGKLNPGCDLYWRVRSMESGGVWSSWSEIRTIRCKAPGTPLVDPSVNVSGAALSLVWTPSAMGERPDHYRIYGSDFRGFIASDSSMQLLVGTRSPTGLDVVERPGDATILFGGPHWWDVARFPSNLLDSTSGSVLTLQSTGGGHSLLKANYRVVAVDNDGTESGASGLISLSPLPWIYPMNDTLALREQGSFVDSVRSVSSRGSYTWNNWNPGWWNEGEITYSAVNAPSWLDLDAKNGALHGIPADTDTTIAFTVRATSSVNGATNDRTVQVKTIASNHAPLFGTDPSLTAIEDQAWETQVVATDPDQERYGDSIRYRIEAGPTWVGIDSTTGRLHGTPDSWGVVDSILVVSASDQLGARSTHRLAVHVKHVNHIPSVRGPLALLAREGETFSEKIQAIDRDSIVGDHLTFSVVGGPSWLQCDPRTGMLEGRPTAYDVGTGVSNIRVLDDSGAVGTMQVTIRVIHVNHPPVLAHIREMRAIEDQPLQFDIAASDPDSLVFSDKVRFSIHPVSSWLSVDPGAGHIGGVPQIQHLADSVFTIIATDDAGAADSVRIVIPVTHVNHTPSFVPVASMAAVEDSLYAIGLHPVDPDSLLGDHVHYRMLAGPGWLVLDTLTGRAEGIPRSVDVGSGTLTMVARDDSGAMATLALPFMVRHTNHAPVVTTNPLSGAIEDSLYSSQIGAADVDTRLFGDTLRFTPVLKPAWLNVDPHTGALAGIPRAGQLADTTLAVAITDGKGGAASLSMGIRVAHTNHAPVFVTLPAKNAGAVEHAPFSMSCGATDADASSHGDVLSYALAVRPSWLSIDERTGLVTGVPPEGASDTTFTVTATDGFAIARLVVPLAVQAVNDPPLFIGRITLTIPEDSSTMIDLGGWVHDPDNDRAVLGFGIRSTVEGADCHYEAASPESTATFTQAEDSLVVVLDTTSAQLYVRAQKNFCGSQIPFVVSARDPEGLVAYDTLLVNVIPVNDPPVLAAVPPLTLAEDDSILVPLAHLYTLVTDPDDPDSTLSWTCQGDSSVHVRWTPQGLLVGARKDWNGCDTITVTVADRGGLRDSARVVVHVRPVNDAPVFARIPALTAHGDSVLLLGLAPFVSDVDDPVRTLRAEITIVKPVADTETRPGTGYMMKPDPAASVSCSVDSLMTLRVWFSGRFRCDRLPIEVRVTDPQGGVGVDTVYLSAIPAIHPPVIQTVTDTVAVPGTPYASSVRAHSPDGVPGPLMYSLYGPAWLHIDSTGRISGIPPAASEDSVLVVVEDERGAADSLRFHLSVRATAAPDVPATYVLQQNYPNPFNPSTTIRFGLPERSRVSIEVFSILGQRVATVVAADLSEGYQSVQWAPSGLASGTYFIVLEAHGLVSAARDARMITKASLIH